MVTAFLLTADQVANAGGVEALIVDTGEHRSGQQGMHERRLIGSRRGTHRESVGSSMRSLCRRVPAACLRQRALQAGCASPVLAGQRRVLARHADCPQLCPSCCACRAAGRLVNGTYGRRVALHEAGHFLVAYMLGLLPKGYTLSSLDLFLRWGRLTAGPSVCWGTPKGHAGGRHHSSLPAALE